MLPVVVWYKNDKMIASSNNVKVKLNDEEKKTGLIIQKVTTEDEGTYVCKITSDIGMTTTKAKLRVSGEIFQLSIVQFFLYM